MTENYANSLYQQSIEVHDENVLEEIIIKPKLRYAIISSFNFIVMYFAIIMACFVLPAQYHGLVRVLYVVLIISFLSIVWSVLSIICTSWTLTGDQLCYKRGVIARRIDYLELYRVTDYLVKESVLERLLGLCSFYVVSTDATSPILHIYGIPHLLWLQREIRKRVEQQRKEKRIYEIGNNIH